MLNFKKCGYSQLTAELKVKNRVEYAYFSRFLARSEFRIEMANLRGDLSLLTFDELKTQLEEKGLPLTGSKAVLRERLRGALETEETEENYEVFTNEQVNAMKKDELVNRLRELSLKTTGNKGDLRIRLKAALEIGDEEEEDQEDDNHSNVIDSSSEEEAVSNSDGRADRRQGIGSHPTLTFRDVEDALETFSGDGSKNFQRWITNFEETADLCVWTEVQKVIYAKILLRGSAKLFVNFECQAKSWRKLRKSLEAEFSATTNSKQVHRQLSLAKKKSDETFQEYIYRVLDIASHAEIELEAKIQYIIDGIQDNEANKSVLYGATTIKELRKKFTFYEALLNRSKGNADSGKQKHQAKDRNAQGSQSGGDPKGRRCYNCGDRTHLGSDCPNKSKGTKCFSCGEFGHIAPECSKGSKKSSIKGKTRCDAVMTGDKKSYKKVSILGEEAEAMIDSGSDLHLARSSFYIRLGTPPLNPKVISFGSVGINQGSTLGSFNADVIVDGISIKLQVHVVPDNFISHDILIGGGLSDLVEVRLKKGQVRCLELEEEDLEEDLSHEHSNTEVSCREVMNLNINFEGPEFNFLTHHIKEPTLKKKIDKLIENYKSEATEDSGVKMQILLKDEIPVFQNPQRLSADHRATANKIIESWLEKGIVKESISEYASPVVLTSRKNGDPRLCVDYRVLNKKIIRDRYPLPLIEDLLDRLQGAKVFSTLDLKDGFFHVPLEPESTKFTAFVVPDGHYEFLRVPFGLCNSPAVFQRHIRAIFRHLMANGTMTSYLDDIIISTESEEENVEKLQLVLELASKHGLIINWKKCTLLVREVEYLGYIVKDGTIRPSEVKTRAVMDFPKPRSIKEIQSFVGLTGYFRKFIPQYATIARPLTRLLKDGIKFEFGSDQIRAFEELKTILAREPVLKLYRVGAETELHTDASKLGLGAIMLQKDSEDGFMHPVFFASWKTSPTEEIYTSYELEILAVVKALEKFRVYLLNIPIKIVTDCRAFAQTMSKKQTCLRVQRWAILIESFQYTIEHRPGTSMRHVDALSRNPVSVYTLQEKKDGLISQIQAAQEEDTELQKIIEAVKDDKSEDFTLKRGVLYREKNGDIQLVVPKVMQHEIIKQAHDRGHFGVRKTEHAIQQEFWFPGIRTKIEKHIESCIKCILAEKKHGKAEGFLNLIDKGAKPLDTYHIDHLGPLPSTKKRYNHIFVVTDSFTKFSWIYPTKSTTAEEAVERLRTQAVIFGNPRRIIADRGSAFTSNLFQNYCKTEGIERVLITTGIPRGNGQVERVNRVIIPVLAKLSMENPADWHKYIGQLQQHLNSSFHRSIGMTPFELMIGAHMKLTDDLQIRSILEEETIAAFHQGRSKLRDDAISNLTKIQLENKRTADRKRKAAHIYKDGDLVAIRRTQGGNGLKLHPKFFGPYKVVSVLRNDRYLVEKIGDHEGPFRTSSSADHMKQWPSRRQANFDSDSENEDEYS